MKRRCVKCIESYCEYILILGALGCSQNVGAEKNNEKSTESIIDSNSADSESETIQDTDTESETSTCTQPEAVELCEGDWCKITPGCFLYGSFPTEPCRSKYSETQVYVTLTHPYEILKTEMTQEKWEQLGLPNPSTPPTCADCPVTRVNWFETLAYCNALSDNQGLERCYDLACCEGMVGSECENEWGGTSCYDAFECSCNVYRYGNVYECPGYRLPTTAEWEYAARAGTKTETYNGDTASSALMDCAPDSVVDEIAWSCSNTTWPMAVALKKKNDWGLYDMVGNLYEWCSDPYENVPLGLGQEHLIDPHGFTDESSYRRAITGSCWEVDPSCCRSASNRGADMTRKWLSYGFRPVRTLFE